MATTLPLLTQAPSTPLRGDLFPIHYLIMLDVAVSLLTHVLENEYTFFHRDATIPS